MTKLECIVTGTGRCGTVYCAKLLTSLGLSCLHEGIFTPDGFQEAIKKLKSNLYSPSEVSQLEGHWQPPAPIKAEASYMAAPFIDRLENTKIIHIVRNPLRVIFSFVDNFNYFKKHYSTNQYEKFIFNHLPELKSKSLSNIERATLFYVRWNQLIENKSSERTYFFHRIEDDISNMLSFLKLKESPTMFNNTRANSHIKGKFTRTIHDIPNGCTKQELLDIAKRYNYNLIPTQPKLL